VIDEILEKSIIYTLQNGLNDFIPGIKIPVVISEGYGINLSKVSQPQTFVSIYLNTSYTTAVELGDNSSYIYEVTIFAKSTDARRTSSLTNAILQILRYSQIMIYKRFVGDKPQPLDNPEVYGNVIMSDIIIQKLDSLGDDQLDNRYLWVSKLDFSLTLMRSTL
jgi:hypothetical protein